jgi:DnaA family protein
VSRQIALDLRLRDASSFENFHTGANAEAVAAALRIARGDEPGAGLFLFGPNGSGKTHLLEAACRACAERGRRVAFVPLKEFRALDPACLDALESVALVCLDDIDAIAGEAAWERALFALYERMPAPRRGLMVTAQVPPGQLSLQLADLRTRLATLLCYELAALTDAEKILALQSRARNRGLDLDEDAARYLITRFPRDAHFLFGALDRLDEAALAAKRRITIPFIREFEGR